MAQVLDEVDDYFGAEIRTFRLRGVDQPTPSRAGMIPLGTKITDANRAEALRVFAAGLGNAEVEMIVGFALPFFWLVHSAEGQTPKSGTAFFLNIGKEVFGVTAAHVINAYLEDHKSGQTQVCRVGGRRGAPISVHVEERIIDSDPDLDIVTFWLSPREIDAAGAAPMSGDQKKWPPDPPLQEDLLAFAGFPGVDRTLGFQQTMRFGYVAAHGSATSVNEDTISIQIERDKQTVAFGPPLPENFDFGGISGGPVIRIIESKTLRFHVPVGVIFSGPNTSPAEGEAIAGFELIRARPIHYILRDGKLDKRAWSTRRGR
jgi:hypothetical protein